MDNRHKPTLSLLTAYRNRQAELDFLLTYLAALRNEEGFSDFELVVVEGTKRATMADAVGQHAWVNYQHVPMEEDPKRARLLNQAAEIAEGDFVMAYRVDTLPAKGVLRHHLALAAATPRCLIAGYRLCLPERLAERLDSPHSFPTVNELIERSITLNRSLAFAEDTKPGLLKSLLTKTANDLAAIMGTHISNLCNYDSLPHFNHILNGWGNVQCAAQQKAGVAFAERKSPRKRNCRRAGPLKLSVDERQLPGLLSLL